MPATIIVLIDHPTISDTKRPTPFTSDMYFEFRQWLEMSGFALSDVTFKYVMPSYPPKNDTDEWFTTKGQAAKLGFVRYSDYYVHPSLAANMTSAKAATEGYSLILTMGDIALLAMTGQLSANKWRGSKLFTESGQRLMPLISLIKANAKFEWKFFIRYDLSQAFRFVTEAQVPPVENFLINPTFNEAVLWLTKLTTGVSREIGVDIETRMRYISYISVATSPTEAICIPWVQANAIDPYWTLEEEVYLVRLLNMVMARNTCIGQNFNYDLQYMIRHWGSVVSEWKDTMIHWHVCNPALPKSLAFIASMTLPYYVFWKDEGGKHIPDPSQVPEYQRYNCKDAAYTLQAWQLMDTHATPLQRELSAEQHETAYAMLLMVLRGVKQDLKERQKQLSAAMNLRMRVEGDLMQYNAAFKGDYNLTKNKSKSFWYQSPTQLAKLLYECWGLPVQYTRGGVRRPTTDDDALKALGYIEPLFKPIFQLVLEYRSLNVFISTFLEMKLDWDKRLRCSYGVGMAVTFRCTSSADAFDFGGNLQNIPAGNTLELP
jgi:hypothetical protein